MRIDTHQHFWRFDAVRDAWITPEMSLLRRDFLPDDIAPAMRSVGIDASMAVQADQSEAETDFLLDLAAQFPMVRGVVGWVDLCAPDLETRVARWRGNQHLKGFRHIAQGEPDDFLTRDDVIAGVHRLGELGYSYDVLIWPRQLDAAAGLIAQCPHVQFILDHCAKPPIATGALDAWRTGLTALARRENVVCKLSGLVTEASWSSWTDIEITHILDVTLDAFGAARLMFGSDWPVCLLAASYERVVGLVNDWAARLPESERTLVFGGTAVRVYRL